MTNSNGEPVMRHVLVECDGEHFLVKVADDNEWEQTLRYFNDCGLKFSTRELLEPLVPGELSDILAPRDE
jgi:hypothetical protein